jgi:glucose/mannose transport system substrate-binding protein
VSLAPSTFGEGHGAPFPALDPPDRERRLRALVDQNRTALARYLARIGVPRSELDDAMQEAFVVVATKLAYLPVGSERAFLFASAHRVAGNARRGLHRRLRANQQLEFLPSDPPPSAEDLTDQLYARAMLEEALDELPLDLRLVFLLFELHEMPLASIAGRLGLPEGTVTSRLRRARETLDGWMSRLRASAGFEQSRARLKEARPRQGAGDPEVLSWWVSRGEADALAALLRVYERSHPNMGAVHAAIPGTSSAREQLRARMVRGVPPDTFQMNGGTDLASWVGHSRARERMEPLDFLFSSEGWASAFPRDVLDLVSCSGRVYAVPVDVHRLNLLFYSQRIFDECNVAPPTTLAEMHEAADVLKARGFVPFAIGYRQPWTLTMLAFENVMVAVAGGAYYRDFFSGRCSASDPELRITLEHVARILDYANQDAPKLGWDGAVELLRSGKAAMTIMGDWAKGYLMTTGTPQAFRQTPSPGSAGAFVFATDTFGLPKRASQRAGAIELLKVFGSKEGQDAFNPLKGSIPARMDADLSRYDLFARATAYDFWNGPRFPGLSSLAPRAFTSVLEDAMAAFAKNRDASAVVAAIRAHYDLLAR